MLDKPNKINIGKLLNEFMSDLKRCATLVSHNVKSDLSTLNNELQRYNINKFDTHTFCTMAHTKTYCNCKDVINRLKAPTLKELHHKLFDEYLDDTLAHNSYYDVEMCAKCYFKCVTLGL